MKRISAALFLRAAAVVTLLAVAGCAAVTMPAVHSEPERLELAKKMAKERQWQSAIELLKTYIDRNAGSSAVDQAIYLLGQCYINIKDFPSASVEFERILNDYPESDSSGAASFRLGDALYGQSRPPDFDQDYTHRALEQWERFRRDYPTHWLVPEAGRRIAKCRVQLASKLLSTADLYMKLRQYEPAKVYYRRVEQEYDDTPLLGDAMIGLARCDAYQGRVADAVAHLKDMETRFAGQPLGERAARERSRIEHMGPIKPQHQTHVIPANP